MVWMYILGRRHWVVSCYPLVNGDVEDVGDLVLKDIDAPLFLETWSKTLCFGLQTQHAEALTAFPLFSLTALRTAFGLAVINLFSEITVISLLTCLAALSEIGLDLVKAVLGTMFLFGLGSENDILDFDGAVQLDTFQLKKSTNIVESRNIANIGEHSLNVVGFVIELIHDSTLVNATVFDVFIELSKDGRETSSRGREKDEMVCLVLDFAEEKAVWRN
ncbi:hypothetical protein Tco_0141072 [Tanacetum coccineum]